MGNISHLPLDGAKVRVWDSAVFPTPYQPDFAIAFLNAVNFSTGSNIVANNAIFGLLSERIIRCYKYLMVPKFLEISAKSQDLITFIFKFLTQL